MNGHWGFWMRLFFHLMRPIRFRKSIFYCMVAMCKIKLKETEEAKEAFMTAWDTAKPDGLLEVFIEHHGLLQGVMESCLKKAEPEAYKALTKGIISFSRGWMKIHNQESEWVVTDALTPQEFAIAMLACRDWSNQEIADCMGLSVNTVKTHHFRYSCYPACEQQKGTVAVCK